MERSTTLTLISRTYTTDAIGQRIPVETERTVFCRVASVSRSEWATAGQLGLKPDLVATMFAYDYHSEEEAILTDPLASTERSYLLSSTDQQLTDSQRQLLTGDADEVEGSPIKYGVYRTYLRGDETIELYLERKTGVSNG